MATFTAQTLAGAMPQPEHQTGDWLICVWIHDDNSLGALPSGWTSIDSGSLGNGNVWAAYYKKAASSSEVFESRDNTLTKDQLGCAIVVSGADGTTPFDATTVSVSDSGQEYNAPDITPASAGSLILYLNLNDFRGFWCTPMLTVAEAARDFNGQSCVSVAYTYGDGAGVSVVGPKYVGARVGATWAQRFITIAIKDDGNNTQMPYIDRANPPATLLHPMFAAGGAGFLQGSNVLYNPTTEIPSITNDNTTFNAPTIYSAFQSEALVVKGLVGASLETSSVNDSIEICGSDFLTTTDLSGAVLSFTWKGNTTRDPDTEIGLCLGLSDKTNSRIWQLDAINQYPNGSDTIITAAVEVDGGYHIDDIGTFNSASVTNMIAAGDILNGALNAITLGPLYSLATFAIKGGNIGADMANISAMARTSALRTIQDQFGQIKTQFFCVQSVEINTDSFGGGNAQSISYAPPYSWADQQNIVQVTAGKFSYLFNPPSGATYDVSGWAFNMGNYHSWGVKSGAAGAVLCVGAAITRCTPVLNDIALTGFTISNSKEAVYTTLSDMSGGDSFIGCVDPQQITITSKTDFEKLQNCDFSNCSALAIKITGNQTGTWSATGMTVSDGGGSYDIEYTGTTDFTIEFDVGSGFSQGRVNNSSTGTLTVSVPTVSLTVTSNIAASDIKIFETGTQTIEASATGTSASTSVAGTYDWTVQKAGYLPQRGTGVVLGTSNVPVSVTLIKDPVYSASHGLAYTTDFTYNGITKKLTCVTRQAGRDFYSAMIDAFIAQSSLDNTPFPLTAVGIDSIFFNDDAELLDATSQDNWFDAGIRYINSSGTTTAEWCSIKSSGSIPAGVTGRYQTGAGTGTTALRTTGAVNQIIQIYGDATHGNFDHRSYLVIKFQANPYVDTRSNILALAGVSTLEPFEYSVAIEPTALNITAGDSGAVLTLVDHTAAPITVGGKSFSYEIQDGGTNSAEAILRAWDYNIAQTGTYQGTDTFNLPEFIAQSGSTYETRRGIVETKGSTLYGCYVSRGGSDHPDFTRHQSDDGTYYDKPVTANITITNLPDDVGGNTRLQIYNVTTATEYYSDDPAGTGYSASYTDGVGITAGDSIRIRFAHLNGATSFESGQTFATATSTGFSVDGTTFITANAVYADNALNGSTITKFTADFVNDELDVSSAANFTGPETWAFFCMTLTTANGINEWWGGYEAIDIGNYRNNSSIVSMYFDETFGSTKRQTDSSRIFRSDGVYPVKDPTTTGYGVDINWQVPVYVKEVNTGSAVNKSTVIEALTDQGYTSARAPKLDTIPDDVWQSPKAIPKLLSV